MAPITIIPKACSCCKGERSSRDKSSNLPLPNILYEGSKGSKRGGGGFAADKKRSLMRYGNCISISITPGTRKQEASHRSPVK